jgi:hypothetical protein
MYPLKKTLPKFFWQIPKKMDVIKLYVEVNVMGQIKQGKFIPTHINKDVYITIKHKKTILII